MLRESHPWKAELKQLKLQLLGIASAPLSEDVPDFNIEKPLLYSAIVMRRLIESWKVTDAVRMRKWLVDIYPARPDRKDALMRLTMMGDIDAEFDLNVLQSASMDAWQLVSELLHSGFINWEIDDQLHFSAIYLASKRNSTTRLIRLKLSDYLQLIDLIIADHVSQSQTSVDSDGKLVVELS